MEVLERKGRLLAIAAILFIVFWSQCTGVAGLTTLTGHRNATKMSYVCPPQFIRLGHSCYFFSETKDTWQNALFACKDRDSNLSVPARWEDRNLRNYLNKPNVDEASRWIGGIYDYGARAWKWGGELRRMHYQSFSKMKKLAPEDLQYHCIAMMPELLYRWAPRSCHEPRQYICQTKLKKVPKHKIKEFRRRWQRMGKLNEITVPSVSREVNDPRFNDVTANPVLNPKSYDLRPRPLSRPKSHGQRSVMRINPKSYDLRPNELRKRSRPNAPRRLTRPFPGYAWNRRDPEGSYHRNVEILRSGRTGLSPQQVNAHLARLQHMKNKQLARRKRLRDRNDWMENNKKPALSQTHVKTYTVDNNISALHPKTIVEEFEMMAPPPPPAPPAPPAPVPVVRPSRAIG